MPMLPGGEAIFGDAPVLDIAGAQFLPRNETVPFLSRLKGIDPGVELLLKQGLRGMQDPCRLATIDEMLGQPGGQTDTLVELLQEDETAVGALRLGVETGEKRL